MNAEEAKKIAEAAADTEYVSGPLNTIDPVYVLDGRFTADELEALAICLRARVKL